MSIRLFPFRKKRLVPLFQAFGLRDRIIVSIILTIGIGALVFWLGALYVASTTAIPERGGEYTEGIAAQPRYINPLISQTSEADADLVELIYSGLFSYNGEGQLVKRLADDWSVSDDGKTYTVTLKKGVKWHDGEELTADDVLFTIKAIQDPAYKSPLRNNWTGVNVATVDRYTLTFSLNKSYFGFLDYLTVGILPKHVWENVAPENFLLADLNRAPIGSGPYRYYGSDKDSSGNILTYELRAFKDYFQGEPYISKVVLHFYPDEAALVDAYNRKEILGINSVTPATLPELQSRKSTHVYSLHIPRIFSVFFNVTKNAAVAHDEVRQALAYATDRDGIIKTVLNGNGDPAYSALVPFMAGYASDLDFPHFDPAYGNKILDDNGWAKGADGVRSKNGTPLALTLTTPDWPELTQTAELLKSQWRAVGANVTVNVQSGAALQQNVIRPREYEALLFGQAAMLHSDPFSFWHSSGKHDPGFNLSLFDNKDADNVLQDLRDASDENTQRADYRKFQQILIKENPAVFLYSPTYLYIVNGTVKGVDVVNADSPARRLSQIAHWYIKTHRVRK